MRNGKFAQRALPIFMLLINICLSVVVVFLMRHVQNLLDSDVKINLMEIVTQNKDAITSRLMVNIKDLDVISNQITDNLKTSGMTSDREIDRFLEEYSLQNNNNDIFIADRQGVIRWGNGRTIDISGRRYFRLASEGTANISDKSISRIDGAEVFIISVPLMYEDKVIGTLQHLYSHEEMYRMMSPTLFSSQGFMHIINSEGYVILHTGHDGCQGSSDNFYRDLYSSGNREASSQLKDDIQHAKSGFMETTIGGRKLFSAYTPIDKAHDWFLITSVPYMTVSPNGNTVINLFYFILLVVVLIFSSSITYFLWYKNRQRANLERIAFVDPITGGNTVNKFVVDAIAAMQSTDETNFFIMKFDIDNFKYINKFYGFEFGDRVLKHIYENVSGKLMPGEVLARISSDHYVALLLNAEEERLKRMLSSIEYEELILYFSAGVYAVTDKTEGINLMLDKACTAAQEIKGTLGRYVAYYTEEFDKANIRNEQLKRAVQHGIENGEFIPFIQPKVNIDTRRVVGGEALARWRSPEGKMISPGVFIPMCEQTGMIVDIDMMIYEKVLQFLRAHLDAGIACVPISVNFSRMHLLNEDFLDQIVRKREEYNVPASLIEIELTESAIFDNIDNIYVFTEKMHSHGFSISMDDFGSGYSSLNMLKDVPIDVLKIDKGFLGESKDNSRRNIIFSTIVEMATQLNIRIVVEGVEFIENVELMRNCGCSIAQGFYFARPMPSEDFSDVMKKGSC